MASKHLLMSDELYQYVLSISGPESEIQEELRLKTQEMTELSGMMTTPEQVQFLKFLIRLIQAKKAIEIGVFTGYGSLAMAEALPEDGQLLACDKNEEWINVGRPFWQKAGVNQKIEVKIADAITTLEALLAQGKAEQFDFIFIDADKLNYPNYYDLSLKLLRKGGLIVFDNMLQVKELIFLQKNSSSKVIYKLNQQLLHDERVFISMTPLGGGMLLVQKK